MVVLEIDDFLKGAGIEEIKTVDHDLVIATRLKGRFVVEIKNDEERTGLELEKKCRAIDFLTLQKICVLLHTYWEQIQDEINPISSKNDELAQDDPERYRPKYQFNTFEEWRLKTEDSYHNLRQVIEDNLPLAWSATEFILAVKALLHIKEVTLPCLAFIIGPPAGGKTLPISSLRGRNHTYYTDDFNPHAMVSHIVTLPKNMEEGEQHMIIRIRNKLVLAPELAPLFAKREEDLREVLSILVRVADGEGLETDSGVGHRDVSGKYQFNLIGATTEPPWYVWKILTKLGPKLVFLRLPKTEVTHDQLVKMLRGDEFLVKKQGKRRHEPVFGRL